MPCVSERVTEVAGHRPPVVITSLRPEVGIQESVPHAALFQCAWTTSVAWNGSRLRSANAPEQLGIPQAQESYV